MYSDISGSKTKLVPSKHMGLESNYVVCVLFNEVKLPVVDSCSVFVTAADKRAPGLA